MPLLTYCTGAPAPLPPQPHRAMHRTPSQAKASRAYGRAGAIAGEAVSNMRTVAAFGREEAVLRSYASALAAPTKVRAALLRWAGVCWPAFPLSPGQQTRAPNHAEWGGGACMAGQVCALLWISACPGLLATAS